MSQKESDPLVTRRDVIVSFGIPTALLLGLEGANYVVDWLATPSDVELRHGLLPSRHLTPLDEAPMWYVPEYDGETVPWTKRELDIVWDGVKHIPQSFFDHWFGDNAVSLFLTDGSPLYGGILYGAFALTAFQNRGMQAIGFNVNRLRQGQLLTNATFMHENVHLIVEKDRDSAIYWEQFVMGPLGMQQVGTTRRVYYPMNPRYRGHDTANWRECIASGAETYTYGRAFFDAIYRSRLSAETGEMLYETLREEIFLGYEYTTLGTIGRFFVED